MGGNGVEGSLQYLYKTFIVVQNFYLMDYKEARSKHMWGIYSYTVNTLPWIYFEVLVLKWLRSFSLFDFRIIHPGSGASAEQIPWLILKVLYIIFYYLFISDWKNLFICPITKFALTASLFICHEHLRSRSTYIVL